MCCEKVYACTRMSRRCVRREEQALQGTSVVRYGRSYVHSPEGGRVVGFTCPRGGGEGSPAESMCAHETPACKRKADMHSGTILAGLCQSPAPSFTHTISSVRLPWTPGAESCGRVLTDSGQARAPIPSLRVPSSILQKGCSCWGRRSRERRAVPHPCPAVLPPAQGPRPFTRRIPLRLWFVSLLITCRTCASIRLSPLNALRLRTVVPASVCPSRRPSAGVRASWVIKERIPPPPGSGLWLSRGARRSRLSVASNGRS